MSDTRQVRPLKYEQVYPEEWTPNSEMRERYKELFYKVKEWPREDSAKGQIFDSGRRGLSSQHDEIQVMLMSLVMLFSSDFLDLDDSKLVSDIQAKYGLMLYRYLKTKYLNKPRQGKTMAVSKYIEGMYVSSMSREMKEIRDASKVGRDTSAS